MIPSKTLPEICLRKTSAARAVFAVTSSNLVHSPPDDVFVVSTIDERVHFAANRVAKKDAAFDAFAKKDFGSLGQKLFAFAVALQIQIFTGRKNSPDLAGCQLVGSVEIGEFFGIDLGNSRIFIVTHCLAGRDLPDAVPS